MRVEASTQTNKMFFLEGAGQNGSNMISFWSDSSHVLCVDKVQDVRSSTSGTDARLDQEHLVRPKSWTAQLFPGFASQVVSTNLLALARSLWG